MRIVNRETFMKMPTGTLFSKYLPAHFGELSIKTHNIGNDFLYQSIADAVDCESDVEFVELLVKAQTENISLAMDFESDRADGLYKENQLFAVWGTHDVKLLIEHLQNTLSTYDAETAEKVLETNLLDGK